jgi:hypothetical protein
MFANSFRRIALAQGLLPAEARRSPPDCPPLAREAEPATGAPEPCEDRDDAA